MINYEVPLLCAVVYDRVAYESVAPYLDPDSLTSHAKALWTAVAAYYKTDPKAKQADTGVLLDRLVREFPKHRDTFAEMIRGMDPSKGSRNVAQEVIGIQRRASGEKLMVALSTDKTPDELKPLLDEFSRINDSSGLIQAGGSMMFEEPLSDLIHRTENSEARIKLLPKGLNKYLRGGVLPGHNIVVFGRVNVGKSTLAINLSAGFLRQGLKVQYVENEDLIEDTAIKMACRLVGRDRDWCMANRNEFQDLAMARGFGNFILPDPAPDSVMAIDRMVGQVGPNVLVVNQARNLTQGSKDTVQQLDNIARGIRDIGKRRRIVTVPVTAAREEQGDDTGAVRMRAEHTMADVYSSRTGFPASADVMLGVGSDQILESQGQVCISQCKNKLGSHQGKTKTNLYVHVDFARGIISE